MNPSTYDLLAGIHAAPGAEVIVLPNSPNVILAAERAAELSEKPARVVPTRRSRRASPRCSRSTRRAGATRTPRPCARPRGRSRIGGVAPAARDDAQGRFSAGDAVGYAGDELVAWGDPAETLAATLARLADGAELVTCLAGDGAPLDRARRRVARPGRRRGRVPRGRPARVVVAALRGVEALRLEGPAAARRAHPFLSEAEPARGAP